MAQQVMPNILFITCHDLGRFLGSYGVTTVQTPHLDRFAADGYVLPAPFALLHNVARHEHPCTPDGIPIPMV